MKHCSLTHSHFTSENVSFCDIIVCNSPTGPAPICFVTDNHARFGFRLLDGSTGRRLEFACRDVTDYERWLEAFAVERRVVAEDDLNGFNVTSLMKYTQLQQSTKGMQILCKLHTNYDFVNIFTSHAVSLRYFAFSGMHC